MPYLYITFSQCSLRSPHFACRTVLTSFLIQNNSNSLSTVVLREYTCSCNNYKRFPLFCATSLLKIILISIGINFLVFKLQHFRRLVSTVNINNDRNINVVSYYHIIITIMSHVVSTVITLGEWGDIYCYVPDWQVCLIHRKHNGYTVNTVRNFHALPLPKISENCLNYKTRATTTEKIIVYVCVIASVIQIGHTRLKNSSIFRTFFLCFTKYVYFLLPVTTKFKAVIRLISLSGIHTHARVKLNQWDKFSPWTRKGVIFIYLAPERVHIGPV